MLPAIDAHITHGWIQFFKDFEFVPQVACMGADCMHQWADSFFGYLEIAPFARLQDPHDEQQKTVEEMSEVQEGLEEFGQSAASLIHFSHRCIQSLEGDWRKRECRPKP